MDRLEFLKIEDKYDLADFFQMPLEKFTYYLYGQIKSRYIPFTIKKRNGGLREITAPIPPLKCLQRRLKDELNKIYTAKPWVHGYINNRSIKTNAQTHLDKVWIAKFDIRHFFPSINFGRVLGIFISPPFNFNKDVAVLLAKLCTNGNELPQGAPTSSILSNMVCKRLDRELKELAGKFQCSYSRYSDDITISTTRKYFPESICRFEKHGGQHMLTAGDELSKVISDNGFSLNEAKVRLFDKSKRQIVTGIVVNKKLNIRREYVNQIRGMLHSWEKYGLKSTEERFYSEFDKKNRPPGKSTTLFRQVLIGKIQHIAFIKGFDDPVYLNLSKRLSRLDHKEGLVKEPFTYNKRKEIPKNSPVIEIYCEGKTDYKHLHAAFNFYRKNGRFVNLNLKFGESDEKVLGGSDKLKKWCEELATKERKIICICIFDRDDNNILRDVTNSNGEYKDWGRNVFSFAIEPPEFRPDTNQICIEHLYNDATLKLKDENNRRIYLRSEFSERNGFHCEERVIMRESRKTSLIVDSNVVDRETGDQVAMSKDVFATKILEAKPPFDRVDFSGFESVFETIKEIAKGVLVVPE